MAALAIATSARVIVAAINTELSVTGNVRLGNVDVMICVLNNMMVLLVV